ncbi:Halomucin [Frankliniella fusca]|uniref:Halomucin n=1 Tax=Frankliniella fusca TaxID=407009 RepID=A0AAE1LFZ3_9NEOP|nr:Halomucin [Frankliniella fusca]KAK3925208.1 Halomucin [Frankliniella fusca]
MNNERKKILRRAKYRRLNNSERHEQHNFSDSEGSTAESSGEESGSSEVERSGAESESGSAEVNRSGSEAELELRGADEEPAANEDNVSDDNIGNGHEADIGDDSEEESDGVYEDVQSDSDNDMLGNEDEDVSESDPGSEAESDVGSQQSDVESSDGDSDDEVEGNQPIYPGAPITLHESLLAIFTLMSTVNLSGTIVSLILRLIALHCPEGSIIKKTLHTFKVYFSKIGEALMVFHYFCAQCIYPLNNKSSECPKCKKSGNVSYFLELPLFHQLQNLLKRDNFYTNLQFRFKENRKRSRDCIEDIYDGYIYKQQMENGFLSNPSNISFMWYSDGVSIFKSSSFSIWPLCLVINELPYKLRSLPENILLVGLWFGKHKPSPNVFLRPLYKTMKNFESNGFTFKLPDNSDIKVKGKVICGTCDLPAKSKFMQFKQFNSYFGCPKCLIEGERAAAGRTTVQVYPFKPTLQKRTHAETIATARQALEARKRQKDASILGVKGPTLLARIVPDIIKCTAIDIMHGVALGVTKSLLNLWFSSKFSTMPWSVYHLLDVADEKLKKFKSPSFTQRAPRSLKEIKFWKASEYKLFLMYYSIPVMKNILPEVHLKHHCLLVSATFLLTQDSISLNQVQAASALLVSYVSSFANLYSLRYMGLNVHQLLHLPDEVLALGPLWVYSCFFLENFNGRINKFFHGTQHVALQICSSASMFMQIPIFKQRLLQDSQVKKFCDILEEKCKPFKIADVIDNFTYAVGTYSHNYQDVHASKIIIRECLRLEHGSCSIFYRLKKEGVMFFSKEYQRFSTRKESSYVSFQDEDTFKLGRILRFVRWSECRDLCDVNCRDCPVKFLAIIKVFKRQYWFAHDMVDVRLSYMNQVYPTDQIVATEVKNISNLCFFMEVNTDMYIAMPINRLEIE